MHFFEGQTSSMKKIFTEKDVKTFSNISMDKNPIHLDEKFAKKSIFKTRIVHGILVSSLISSVIANKLPGPGSIYLNQTLNFIKPVFLGDEITASVTISKYNPEKNNFFLKTTCTNQDNKIVIDGNARILLR